MKPLLEIKNLSVKFKNSTRIELTAVKNFSAKLENGKVLGIVGESGSGKSVTALSILGLLPEGKALYSKESQIYFKGQELIGANPETMRAIRGQEIGFIFQEPQSSLNPLHSVGAQIVEAMTTHQDISPQRARARAVALLQEVGIQNAKARFKAFPFELSGGQKQRVMIAMAVANTPEILIADEPTTALDVTIQAQIIKLLQKLKETRNMSIIFISHDLHLISQIADDVIVMKEGKIVEKGTARQIFEHPQESYTKQLMNSFKNLNLHKNDVGDVVAKVENIEVTYPLQKTLFGRVLKSIHAVDHVSLTLRKSETLGIVGESGSGKTTLGLSLCHLIKHKGKTTLFPPAKDDKDFRRRVQIVFQDPYNSLNPRFTIADIVGEGLKVHFKGLSKAEIRKKVLEILKETGLKETDLDKYPHQFSGGQRQRVAIARALILEPEIVVLDEPTSALDVTVQAQILEMLQKIQQKHKVTYIFISHDMRAVKAVADMVGVMKNGKIVEMGTMKDIFENPKEPYTKELIETSMANGSEIWHK